MNVFDADKQSVTTREAAKMYGVKVSRNNMASCPFHSDRTPSNESGQALSLFWVRS